MDISNDIAVELIEPLAQRLTELKKDQAQVSDSRAWDMARAYVAAYGQITELCPGITTYEIHRKLKAYDWYAGPGGSWLSNARRIYDVFPDFFTSGSKNIVAYNHAMCIANCSLSAGEKDELLNCVMVDGMTRRELRHEIQRRKDKETGVTRPDFDLKVSNLWKFSQSVNGVGWDGGIHPDLVANLIYYYTDPGDVVVDPMAGGDVTHRVVSTYKFFSDDYEGDFGGQREVYRSDISPQSPGIDQADVTEGLPWPDDFADLAIMDPPYYGMAAGKYTTWGETINDWLISLDKAICNVHRVLKSGGRIAIVTDDYTRKDEFHPLGLYTLSALQRAGMTIVGTMYDPNPNFVVTMGPAQMWRTKRSRLQVSEMKIINVAAK